VALIVPPGLPRTAGNWVTAMRLAEGLRGLGWRVEVYDAAAVPVPSGRPTVHHALHALHAAPSALRVARRGVDPVVVTLTGTDLAGGERLAEVLAACDAVVAFSPGTPGATDIIPPGVVPLPGRRRRREFGWRRGEVAFLLPAGLREVKRPWFALPPLARLRAAGLPVRLAIAGPVREAAAAARLQQAMAGAGAWASYLGELPRGRMGDLYRSADVVLNTSRSEGLSNAVLEAMALGRPVLAADIPGNRAAVRHGRDGLLFPPEDEAAFAELARHLAADPGLRRRLGRAAARRAARTFSPGAEARAHARLYERLLAGRG
jgi:glycosyltransferase involved in cell wall biosynthesis